MLCTPNNICFCMRFFFLALSLCRRMAYLDYKLGERDDKIEPKITCKGNIFLFMQEKKSAGGIQNHKSSKKKNNIKKIDAFQLCKSSQEIIIEDDKKQITPKNFKLVFKGKKLLKNSKGLRRSINPKNQQLQTKFLLMGIVQNATTTKVKNVA